jgi:DHA2 family multidrug resistance protein-like MFS transporter
MTFVRLQRRREEALPKPREPKHTAAIAAVLAAMVLVVLDAAIANVALPTIARSLEVTPAASMWVVIAYQSALLMALLPCAALGESLGHRRVFVAGVALFIAASVLCALSPSLPWLVAARFVQGLGGSAVLALGVALLRVVVAPPRLGAAIGWNALAVALSAAAGPPLGAALLSVSSWHGLFAVNLPLGMMVLFSARALPRVAGTGRRLDLFSAALNAGVFATMLLGAEMLATKPAATVLLFAATALAAATLVRRESAKEAPLVPLDLLRASSFRVSVIASVCCFAGQSSGMVALPFYLQQGLGQDTLTAGLYMTAWPMSVAIVAPFAGRLADRVASAWTCAAGALCLACGLGLAAAWPLATDPRPLMPITMLCGTGFALFNVGNNRNLFLAAPAERSGAAGGMQGTARLFGQTVGSVLATLLFTAAPADVAPRIGLAVGAMWALAAGVVSAARSPACLSSFEKEGSISASKPLPRLPAA